MKYRDEICKKIKCLNHPCQKGCPWISYVNGKTESKEALLSNITLNDNCEYKDYNKELATLSEDRENRLESEYERIKELIEAMRKGKPSFYHKRKMAIMVMLVAGICKKDIADIIQLDISNIYKAIK
jgi:hypothetical protein